LDLTDRGSIPRPGTATTETWPRLRPGDVAATLASMMIVAVVAAPRLAPGVCFGDSGGLQLAAATLGITHPPGYPGYATLGYVAGLLPGVTPARAVTLLFLLAGLGVLGLGVLVQIRMGVGAWTAAAIMLVFTLHKRLWPNLIVPEVYLPTLALLAGTCYLLMRYAHRGGRGTLVVAAGLFGLALGNRPPVVLFLPFLVVALILAERQLRRARWSWTRSLALCGMVALGPWLYSLAYLWARDDPNAAYNYLAQYDREFPDLPDADDGWVAKAQRVYWEASAAQFRAAMGNDWAGVKARLRWAARQLGNLSIPSLEPIVQFSAVLSFVLILLGLAWVVTWTREPVGALLILGLGLHALVFVCAYQVLGQAADLLPLLFSAAVLGGVAGSVVLMRAGGRASRATEFVLFLASAGGVAALLPRVLTPSWSHDAEPFLQSVDVATLPANAVICTGWGEATALWYDQHVTTGRTDLLILNADESRWLQLAGSPDERPVFYSHREAPAGDCTLVPFRNLWRVECPPAGTGRAPGSTPALEPPQASN